MNIDAVRSGIINITIGESGGIMKATLWNMKTLKLMLLIRIIGEKALTILSREGRSIARIRKVIIKINAASANKTNVEDAGYSTAVER